MFDFIDKGRYWDRGWQLIDGCTPCSPSCDHCWSAAMTHRFKRGDDRLLVLSRFTDKKGKFNGTIGMNNLYLERPLKRKKATAWSIWNDLFHPLVNTRFIDSVLEVVGACPQHIFLALTKRVQNIEKKIYESSSDNPGRALGGGDFLRNLWVGVSVCNMDEVYKIDLLRKIIGFNKFISFEPLLGDVGDFDLSGIDWVIVGCETGPRKRPMEYKWYENIANIAINAGVSVYVKKLPKSFYYRKNLLLPSERLPGLLREHTQRYSGVGWIWER